MVETVHPRLAFGGRRVDPSFGAGHPRRIGPSGRVMGGEEGGGEGEDGGEGEPRAWTAMLCVVLVCRR